MNLTLAALTALTLATAAHSETATEKFATARLALFGKGDAAGLLAQYAPDATVITPNGVLHGPDQIKGMVDGIIGEFHQPDVKFTLISQMTAGDVATFTWSAETAKNIYDLGAETYVLKDGRITYQTFAAKVAAR